MKKKKREKSPNNIHKDVVWWSSLLVLLVCNLLVSIVLVPILLAFLAPTTYVIMAIMGLMFGSIFAFFIHHIPELKVHHHVLGALVLATVAAMNIAVMVSISNGINFALNINTTYDPVTVGLVYGVIFLIPYGIYLVKSARVQK